MYQVTSQHLTLAHLWHQRGRWP